MRLTGACELYSTSYKVHGVVSSVTYSIAILSYCTAQHHTTHSAYSIELGHRPAQLIAVPPRTAPGAPACAPVSERKGPKDLR